MDFWMIARRDLKNDLLGIFSALGNLQFRYDWVITDTGLYFAPGTPDEVRKRWSWTGLLMTGRELTQHLSAGYVYFVSGGVLSAVPPGTRAEQVWNYVPYWEIDAFDSPGYAFQTPLTELEILCYDGYAWLIICKPEFSEKILKCIPQALHPREFYRRLEADRRAENKGNDSTSVKN